MKANYETPKKVEGSFSMSLYDMNKQIVSQLPDFTDEDLNAKYDLINEFGKGKTWCMLHGRELNYYTVFHNIEKDAEETFAMAVIDCCRYIGHIKSIDLTENGTIEIWTMNGDEATVLYLFDYEMGVIECQM